MSGFMDDFSTYLGACNIFRRVNCTGNKENCIVGAIVDYSKSSSSTGSMIGNGAFGPAGYVIGGLLGEERDRRVSNIYDYVFALLNFTELGVGIIPLSGGGMKINPEKQSPDYGGFVFFHYQELSEITAKNYLGIRKSVKAITIRLSNGYKLHFNANMVENTLPYQENAMKIIVSKYGK